MDWSEVARDVRERRILLYGSQAALANAAGVTEKTVGKLEAGNPVAQRTLVRVRAALDRKERESGLIRTDSSGQVITKKVPPEYFDLPDEDKQAIDDMILRLARTRPGE